MNDIHDHHLDTGDFHDLTALYAVDALEPAEQAVFEHHFPRCARCQTALTDYAEVAAHLAEAVAQDPPPALRATVLGAIHNPGPGLPSRTGPPVKSDGPRQIRGRALGTLRQENPSPGAPPAIPGPRSCPGTPDDPATVAYWPQPRPPCSFPEPPWAGGGWACSRSIDNSSSSPPRNRTGRTGCWPPPTSPLT